MQERFEGPEGRKLARQTLAVMEKHDISPSPRNYALWSAYVSGFHPAVSSAIDKLVRAGEDMSDAVADELYARHFAPELMNEGMIAVSNDAVAAMGRAQASLRTAGDNTRAYGAALADASGELAQSNTTEQTQKLVQNLLRETQLMQSRTRELEAQLDTATSEVSSLRSKLTEAQEDALTDPLTGLANRKRMDSELRANIAKATKSGRAFSVLIADIDHFKRFNDTWGHQTGDQIIRFVGRTLLHAAREYDIVARYGGEEFAVLLPGASRDDAVDVAEQARQAVESKQLMRKSTNECLGNITISLGVAEMIGGDTPETLVERADKRLYLSKSGGRNRVTAEDPPGSASNAA